MRLPPVLRHPALRHPAVWAIALVLFGALVLLPGIGGPGLWEPQEMAVADEAAARADGTFQPAPSLTACPTTASPSGARTLTPRAAAWGQQHLSTSDAGLRIPMVMIGLLGVLAVFGVGLRLGSRRAGVIAAAVFMSFPLWSLQARQLTGELPGAVGATLLVYGLCVLARPRRDRTLWLALDVAVAIAALVVGARLAFAGSGALVGLLPPLAAVAMAGGFALPELGRLLRRGWRALDRRRDAEPDPDFDWWRAGALLLATVGTAVVSVWIARQVFDLVPRTPGTRALADHSIVTSECWSSAIGGLWRKDDDLRATYDSLFEQAGFGMFPWSILAVIALGALGSGLVSARHRFTGALLLAWAAAGWICAAVFVRKVGPAVFPGFPACAIGIGIFIDDLYARRAAALVDPSPYRAAAWSLCGLAVLFSIVVLSKDLEAFPERMASFIAGNDQIKYPAQARLLGIATRSWIIVLGVLAALPFALDLWLWRAPRRADEPVAPTRALPSFGVHRLAHYGMPVALAMTLVLALFWTHGWHRSLSRSLSSKHIFSVYRDLRKSGDSLGIMGSMGNAPRYYAAGKWDTLPGRDDLITYLRKSSRVFAMAPAGELCAIHKAKADGLEYYVLDDSNPQTLLLSNQLGQRRDRNPIATSILRERPTDLGTPISVTYDGAIEIIGVKLPESVQRGDRFDVTMYYRVLKPISGAWKVFAHFDGGQRFNGDHDPIRGRCATNYWQAGDYIVDRFSASAGDVSFNKGPYEMWVGFFTGSNPNWRNMPVSQGAKDNNNRVKVGTIRLR